MIYDTLQTLSDQAIRVVFGEQVSNVMQRRIKVVYQQLLGQRLSFITDIVPDYTGLTVYYDVMLQTDGAVKEQLASLLADMDDIAAHRYEIVTLPICYGGEFGPDLPDVAAYHGLSEEAVIHRHARQPYLVHMFGFMPGFPYMSGLSSRLAMPRLKTPRAVVKQGSVGIADQQTGVYPLDAPGGWRLLGRTPVSLFAANALQPCIAAIGDYICFQPVDAPTYRRIAERVKQGRYVIQRDEQEDYHADR